MVFHFRDHPFSIVLYDDLYSNSTADGLNEYFTFTLNSLYTVGQNIHNNLIEFARKALYFLKIPIILPDLDPVLDFVMQQYQG